MDPDQGTYLHKKGLHTVQTFDFTGADNRIRTYDLLITNEPLYQLSYTGVFTIFIVPSILKKVNNQPLLKYHRRLF